MMLARTWRASLVIAVALASSAPGLRAQEPQERRDGQGWWRWAAAEVLAGEEVRTTRGQRFVIDRRGAEDEGIPAFCRTGEGHPVFGRDWCIDKGFGLGRNSWRRGGLGDIIFRGDRRHDDASLDRPALEEILGGVILGRMLARSDVGDDAGRLTGRWLELEDRGARVLQLRAGDRPVAELTDLDQDGIVDVALWNAPEGEAEGTEERGAAHRRP